MIGLARFVKFLVSLIPCPFCFTDVRFLSGLLISAVTDENYRDNLVCLKRLHVLFVFLELVFATTGMTFMLIQF